jgi:hypothetical protein
MVDIGFGYGRVHSHATPFDHLFGMGNLNDSLMDLLNHLRPERSTPATHGLGVGHLRRADAGEVAIHQIGAHLALQAL